MLRSLFSLTAAGAMIAGALAALPAPAAAQHYYPGGYGDRGDPYRGRYRDRGYARGPAYGDRRYYGRDRRYYGRCRDNGAGGTILGAIAGGLIGNSVAGYRDRTTGTVVGAGVGALAGRAIDRDC